MSPFSKRLTKTKLIALLIIVCLTTGIFKAFASPQAIIPGIIWYAANNSVIQAHGEGITQVGSTFYWFGEDKTNGSSFQNIKCYSSTDLTHWTFVNNVLTLQSSGDLGPSRVVERPKVIFNSSTNTYVMYMHIDNSNYSERKAGVATSSSICGSYSYRGSFQPLGFQSLDMSLFKDTDGTGYLLSEDRTTPGLRIDKLSSDYLSVVSNVAILADYEAPGMVKVAGRYYLFGSHQTGWNTNDNIYTTATSLSGPWSSWATFAPAGTNTYNSQTAFILPVSGSSTTSYLYLGDRWNPNNLADSRYVWLPLNINGTSVSMSWYDVWTIDTATGAWSVGASTSYEAESSSNTLAGGAVVGTCNPCSGGHHVGYIGNNSGTLQFNNVNVGSTRSYTVIIYFMNGDSSSRSAQMSVNGGGATTITFPPTGAWPSISAQSVSVNLNAGNNTIKFSNSSGWAPDFDKIVIYAPSSSATNTPTFIPPTKTNTPIATATTGPTRTNTPIPTAGPTSTPMPTTAATKTNTPAPTASGGSGLSIQIDKGNGVDNTQETGFNFLVKNTGSSAISGISVRVYFTLDGSNAASGYVLEKYYDQSGVATISGPTLATGSTYYFTVSYGTASLPAGGQWEFQTALHLSSWASTYSGANDWYHTGYAVGAFPASYTATNYIPGYINGTLVVGSQP